MNNQFPPSSPNATVLTGNEPSAKQQNQRDYNACMQLTIASTKPLITEAGIIRTYSEADQFSCQKYFEYLELVKQNPKIGYKKAAKILNISNGSTRWWHTKGPKRAVPLPLKTVEKLKANGLLPFSEEHAEAKDILRIAGTIFGDGCIDRNLNTLSFISANLQNIECWKNDLLRIFPFAKEKINMVEGGEFGHSFCLRTFDRSIIRFFVALGAPVGNKVTTRYSLPLSFNVLPRRLKIAFFDGLFSSEVCIPQFEYTIYTTNYFKNFSLSLSKLENLETEHHAFLNAVKKEMRSLGVSTTGLIRKDKSKTERKDGKKSFGYRIFFRTGIKNVLRFHKTFPLKYCAEKKQKFDQEAGKAMITPNVKIL